MDKLRGNDIELKSGKFYYCNSGGSTADTWENKPCGKCGKPFTKEGHDGCLGTLPYIMNACCGHGDIKEAYIQYWDGSIIEGKDAIHKIQELKLNDSL